MMDDRTKSLTKLWEFFGELSIPEKIAFLGICGVCLASAFGAGVWWTYGASRNDVTTAQAQKATIEAEHQRKVAEFERQLDAAKSRRHLKLQYQPLRILSPNDENLPELAHAEFDPRSFHVYMTQYEHSQELASQQTALQRDGTLPLFDRGKGKRFEWEGYVGSVYVPSDEYILLTLLLKTGDISVFTDCYFALSEEEKLKRLRPQQKIRVQGVMNESLSLTKCELVETL